MYLKIHKRKIPIYEYTNFKKRIKSFRFVLEKVDYGIKLPHKKFASTDFFCQRVDICFTNRDDIIIALYQNVKSEKRFFKFHSYHVYFLPLGTCQHLEIGMKMPIKKK